MTQSRTSLLLILFAASLAVVTSCSTDNPFEDINNNGWNNGWENNMGDGPGGGGPGGPGGWR